MKIALTGIQASGQLHLGNYLGAIQPALELQQEYTAYYFVADYHALTSNKEPEKLRASIREITATMVALGLDTDKHSLFRQSDVPQVVELAWILACQVGVGMLDRGHAVKAARDGGREPNAGTLFYPLLMAADILLYDTNIVPVGQDQKQHLEITRDIAIRINHHYGEGTLVVPEVSIREGVGQVPGIDGRKMSKSYGNGIELWAPSKRLRKRCMKIVTDSAEPEDPKDPEKDNVFALYRLFASEADVAAMAARYREGGLRYGDAKQALYEELEAHLAEPREKVRALLEDPDAIEDILQKGARKARQKAEQTMDRVREAVGLR